VHVAVNEASVPYRVCVLEIAVGLWEGQTEGKATSKMQTQNKLLVHDTFMEHKVCLVGSY
jgi:hypothetical protein